MNIFRSIHNFDLSTFDWCCRRKHREQFIFLSRFLSKSADGPLYLLTALILAFLGYEAFLPVFFAAFALERAIYFALKNFCKRNRPPQAIPGFQSVITPSDQFSFPSGHTSAAFVMLMLVSAIFPTALAYLLPWAIAVGCSRVMLGVHFPTDIGAGAGLGCCCAHTILSVFPIV